MARAERLIAVTCGLVIVGSLGLAGVQAVRNPMQDRMSGMDRELASITHVPEEFVIESNADINRLVKGIVWKRSLWRELVPPPPKRPTPKAKPNLKKMMADVVASKRQQIGRGDKIKIKVVTANDKRGSWKGIGDKIGGLTIMAIDSEFVLLGLERDGREYKYKLPRR